LFYRKKSKYGAIKKKYAGRVYHSKLEASGAMLLDKMKQAGQITDIVPQYKIFLNAYDKHITTHIVDFLITLPNGKKKFVEIKGFPTEIWRLKMKLTQAQHPDIPYLVNPDEKQIMKEDF